MTTKPLIWEDTKLPVLAGEIAEGDWVEFDWFTGEVRQHKSMWCLYRASSDIWTRT
jgi:hypothetical protein